MLGSCRLLMAVQPEQVCLVDSGQLAGEVLGVQEHALLDEGHPLVAADRRLAASLSPREPLGLPSGQDQRGVLGAVAALPSVGVPPSRPR